MKKKHILRKKERKRVMCDSWDLNSSFSAWIVPRLQYLHDHSSGYPTSIDVNCPHHGYNSKSFIEDNNLMEYFSSLDDDISKVWNIILKDMIDGFKDYRDGTLNKNNKVEKSLQLFKIMFYDLWD